MPKLLTLSVILSIALSACSPSDGSYFPLAAGVWRYYQTTKLILDDTVEQRIIVGVADTIHTDNRQLFVMRQAPDQDSFVEKTGDGIFRVGKRNRHLLNETWQQKPTKILPLNPQLGDRWIVQSELGLIESRTFARQDRLRNRTIPLELNMEITALDEVVDVPAGVFSRCVKISGKGLVKVKTDRGNANADVIVIREDWYAPGIGLVKSNRVEESESPFLKNGAYLQELIAVGN
ncbi:MAG: hypothetical protein AAF387_10880 [Pseudomonadota bacterium]